MDNALRSRVERLVRRVRRRLFARTLLESLLLCWSAALLLSALWFLAWPLALAQADETWRWAVAGGFLALGTAGGIVLALLRTPNLVASALALDQQFALKERVTTLLTLAPNLAESPAGQALLADVGP